MFDHSDPRHMALMELHKMVRGHLAKHLGSLKDMPSDSPLSQAADHDAGAGPGDHSPENDGTGKEEAESMSPHQPIDDDDKKDDGLDGDGASDALGEDMPDQGPSSADDSDHSPENDGTGKPEDGDGKDGHDGGPMSELLRLSMKRLDSIQKPKKR